MNPVRQNRPLRRVVPPKKRFDTLDPHAVEFEDRLVEEEEFLTLERHVQFIPQSQTVVGRDLHLRLEFDRLISTLALGPVEGDVGVSQQVLRRLPVSRGDADARGHGDRYVLESVDVERGFQYLSDPFGNRLGPRSEGHSFSQNDELITA
jgi:hypothetical protein